MRLDRQAALWRRERLAGLLGDGALRAGGWSLGLLTAAAWLDRALSLPQPLRWGVWLAGLAALAAAARRLFRESWGALAWGAILDAAAGRFPETPALREHLRSAFELAAAPADGRVSGALRAAHIEAAEALVAALPARRVFPWSASRAARRGAAVGLAAVLTWPWASGFAWQRVLAPWSDTPLESVLELKPGDAAVEWGGSAEISARWAPASPVASRPRDLRLWVKGAEGWRAAPWDALGGGQARYFAEGLSSPLEYRLHWRGLSSRAYRLTPVSAPRLEGLEARVRGEEGEPVPLSAAEPLSVLRGSWVSLRGRPNQALAKAALKLSSWPAPVAFKPLATGLYEAVFQAKEDASLRVELEAVGGRRDPDPPVYALKTLEDQPPKVELLSPLSPLQASPSDVIPVAFALKDDGGVRSVSLLVRPAAGPAREVLIRRFETAPREHLGDHAWRLEGLPLGRVSFQVKAVDNGSPPKTGLSAAGTIEIADLAAGHERARRLWEAAEAAVAAAAPRQAAARAPAQARKLAELEAALPGLGEAWSKSAKSLSELSSGLEQDAYANPGLAAQMQDLAQRFASASRKEVPGLAARARSGDWEGAKEAEESLSALLARTSSWLKEGGELQRLGDLHSQAGALNRQGSELEASLEAAGALSGEAGKELSAALARIQSQLEALRKTVESMPKSELSAQEAARAKELPLEEAMQTAQALSAALARGDSAAAARLARRLSELLSGIQSSLADAASSAPALSSSRRVSERVRKAQALWSEVVEEQTRVLERTAEAEDKRVAAVLEAQKGLLRDLAREQAVIVSSAAATPSLPPPLLETLREAQAEFEAGKVVRSETRLEQTLPWLRQGWPGLADLQDAVLARLKAGTPRRAGDAARAEASSLAPAQAAVSVKTGSLASELEALKSEGAPPEASDRARSARREQDQAEGFLKDGSASSARPREEAALAFLEQAGQQLAQAAASQQGSETGLLEPFSRASGAARAGGPGAGARIGYVNLPSARDYLPPPEIREELKRSMRESRPESSDRAVREYFKRISR